MGGKWQRFSSSSYFSSLVKFRLDSKSQLPRLSGAALKVSALELEPSHTKRGGWWPQFSLHITSRLFNKKGWITSLIRTVRKVTAVRLNCNPSGLQPMWLWCGELCINEPMMYFWSVRTAHATLGLWRQNIVASIIFAKLSPCPSLAKLGLVSLIFIWSSHHYPQPQPRTQ